MKTPLSVLVVEDSQDDTLLAIHELQKADYAVTYERVDTEQALQQALNTQKWDVVISDYSMPHFNGLDALRLLKSTNSDTPFIFVSGTIGEDRAVIAMKAGANDYVLKGNLKRLAPAVTRELQKTHNQPMQLEYEKRFYKALEDAEIGVALIAKQGQFLQTNSSLKKMLGLTEAELQTTNEFTLTHPDDLAKEQRLIEQLTAGKIPSFQLEKRYYHPQGNIIWALANVSLVKNTSDLTSYFIFQIQDITTRKLNETQLISSDRNNSTARLTSYTTLEEAITQILQTATEHDQQTAIALLRLERFKAIAESIGQEATNNLLQAVAERLRTHMRSNDIIARTGRNDFVIVITNVDHKQKITKVGQKILDIFLEPFIIGEQEIVIAANIGISIYPEHGKDYQSLLESADTALQLAEATGGNNYQLAAISSKLIAKQKQEIESILRDALAKGELKLYYQPQIDLGSGKISNIIAQAHLPYRTGKLIPSIELTTIAEETGLIVPMEEWLLHAACLQLKQWQEQLKASFCITVAINLSARQFQKLHLANKLKRELEIAEIAPHCLELELNENTLIHDFEIGIAEVNKLKVMGIKITVNNFSMSYAALNYLKYFNVDKIKLDRTLVRNLPTHLNDIAITKALITMAHTLGIKVIAEGIENKEQLNFLIEHQCDEAQGSHFGQSLPTEQIAEELLKKQNWLI